MYFCSRFYIEYHGRPAASAPATGNKQLFLKELNDFIVSIFGELTDEDKEFIKRRQEAEMNAKENASKPAAASTTTDATGKATDATVEPAQPKGPEATKPADEPAKPDK